MKRPIIIVLILLSTMLPSIASTVDASVENFTVDQTAIAALSPEKQQLVALLLAQIAWLQMLLEELSAQQTR